MTVTVGTSKYTTMYFEGFLGEAAGTVVQSSHGRMNGVEMLTQISCQATVTWGGETTLHDVDLRRMRRGRGDGTKVGLSYFRSHTKI